MDDASAWFYSHRVLQKRGGQTHPTAIEKGLLIILITHSKILARDDAVESEIPIANTQIVAIFSHIKQSSSNESIKAWYTQKISETLSRVRVPQQEHEAIIESIFQGVDTAVSVNPPLEVGIWDITVSRSSRDGSLVPAAESSLQRLEQPLLIESQVQEAVLCPICLQNFNFAAQEEEEEDSTITCLPCSHHFHLHCIVQWLHISHLCPMCRYPMPTDAPQDCIILASLQVPSRE